MKAYLCGGINGLSDAECKDWREAVKLRLPDTLDPMRRDYRGKEAESVNEIVRGDLEDIHASDVVLAMCAKPSWGTAMEIFYAHSIGKPVFAVVPDVAKASPWLAFHAQLFASLDEAIDAIGAA
jgi:nucleoside 2-deoxyribosyltransferase